MVDGALETVPKNLNELEIRGKIETNQITALLKPTRILSKVLVNLGDLLSFRL